jgi:hypothetical protein
MIGNGRLSFRGKRLMSEHKYPHGKRRPTEDLSAPINQGLGDNQ